MKFVNIRLLVGDIRAAISFWRDVMGFRMTFGDEAMGYAYFETDSAGVELMTREGFAAALGETASPRKPEGHPAVLVFRVDDVDSVEKFVRADKGRLSVGGMSTKLQAVRAAVCSGIPTVVASGRKAGEIVRAASGKPAGTYFPPLVPLQAQ